MMRRALSRPNLKAKIRLDIRNIHRDITTRMKEIHQNKQLTNQYIKPIDYIEFHELDDDDLLFDVDSTCSNNNVKKGKTILKEERLDPEAWQ